jgi:hypothetical protein
MQFQYPLLLLLLIPSAIFCYWYVRIQYLALLELREMVHISKLSILTVMFTRKENGEINYRKFWIFQIFGVLALFSIVISVANPYEPGDSQIQTKQTSVYLVFDGSWSMDAKDIGSSDDYAYVPRFRFEEARFHAMALNKKMEDVSFGVITFAGEAVQHTHPLPDKDWINNVLFNQMGSHNSFYSGTNFRAAFQELLNSSRYLGEGFQVVLYSDGDASEEEKAEALKVLPMFTRLKVPIHVIALGSEKGEEINQNYNLLNLVDTTNTVSGDAAGKEYEATSNVVVQTRKSVPDFKFLETIASETGGKFIKTNLGMNGLESLASAIKDSSSNDQILLWEASGKKSMGYLFFILPFLFYLYDFLWVRRAVKLGK